MHSLSREHLIVSPSLEGELIIQDCLEIYHHGDLPVRSGLGTSSSFSVGILHMLHALKGEMVSKKQHAIEVIELEQVRLKENVGIQDQIATAHGGFNKIEIAEDGNYYAQSV